MIVHAAKLAEPACTQARDGVLRTFVSGARAGSRNSIESQNMAIHSRAVEMESLKLQNGSDRVNLKKILRELKLTFLKRKANAITMYTNREAEI